MPGTDYVRLACASSQRVSVAEFVRSAAGVWELTNTSPSGGVEEFRDEPRSSKLAGPFGVSAAYPGCLACGAETFVKCGVCERLSCWRAAAHEFTCGWCGNRGPVSGTIETLRRVE